MKTRFCLACILGLSIAQASTAADVIITFDDLGAAPESFHNRDPFSSQGVSFNNSFTDFGNGFTFWGGWAYSSTTDVSTPGVLGGIVVNDSSAYHLPHGGGDNSTSYGVAFFDPFGFAPTPTIELPDNLQPVSMRVTNTTYTALSAKNGDDFNLPFKTGDYLLLHITGLDANGQLLGTSIEFPLADYRNLNGQPDGLVDHWTTLDLSPLTDARTLVFTLESSQEGTPTFFAMDNLVLTAVPEPAAWLLSLVTAATLWGYHKARKTPPC